jgi:hypothetical protein
MVVNPPHVWSMLERASARRRCTDAAWLAEKME